MKIKLEITINKVEDWSGVNWNDEKAANNELVAFRNEIKEAISNNAGVDWGKIEISKIELIEQ